MDTFQTAKANTKEIGTVVGIDGTIVRVDGLPGAVSGEMTLFESGQSGSILTLGRDSATAIVYSREPLVVGTRAVRTGGNIAIRVGEHLLGATIGALGKEYTGQTGSGSRGQMRPIFTDPPGIAGRRKVSRQLYTGVTMIDRLIPLGYGQRELIIGDRKTGKTNILLSLMETQAKHGVICIYAVIGKRKTEVKRIETIIHQRGIRQRSIIVFASSYCSPGEIYAVPYTAMTIAEYFNGLGNDVVVILDDMTTHAKYYRELSLLAKRFPGRDSYPGDIFHMQAKLLERGGNFLVNGNERSITVLPAAETAGSDMTGYIQTNLMSMTDGHIFCDADFFFRGIRPAVNPFLSVTRVGRQTQTPLGRDVADTILQMLASYEKALGFVRFGADASDDLKKTLIIGESLWRAFSQQSSETFPRGLQYGLIAKSFTGSFSEDERRAFMTAYEGKEPVRQAMESAIQKSKTLMELVEQVKTISW